MEDEAQPRPPLARAADRNTTTSQMVEIRISPATPETSTARARQSNGTLASPYTIFYLKRTAALRSTYLRNLIREQPAKKDGVLTLQDIDAGAFCIYGWWLELSAVPWQVQPLKQGQSWNDCFDLIRAYTLASRLGDAKFQTFLMQELEKWLKTTQDPNVEVLKYVFSENVTQELKDFVVERMRLDEASVKKLLKWSEERTARRSSAQTKLQAQRAEQGSGQSSPIFQQSSKETAPSRPAKRKPDTHVPEQITKQSTPSRPSKKGSARGNAGIVPLPIQLPVQQIGKRPEICPWERPDDEAPAIKYPKSMAEEENFGLGATFEPQGSYGDKPRFPNKAFKVLGIQKEDHYNVLSSLAVKDPVAFAPLLPSLTPNRTPTLQVNGEDLRNRKRLPSLQEFIPAVSAWSFARESTSTGAKLLRNIDKPLPPNPPVSPEDARLGLQERKQPLSSAATSTQTNSGASSSKSPTHQNADMERLPMTQDNLARFFSLTGPMFKDRVSKASLYALQTNICSPELSNPTTTTLTAHTDPPHPTGDATASIYQGVPRKPVSQLGLDIFSEMMQSAAKSVNPCGRGGRGRSGGRGMFKGGRRRRKVTKLEGIEEGEESEEAGVSRQCDDNVSSERNSPARLV
jgi:hypothetical protein